MMTNSNSNLSRTSERTKSMVRVAVMAGIAFVLMFIDFPLLFVAPSFMKLDLSDVPGLIAGFAMGPAYGVMVQFIKVLLNLSKSQISRRSFTPMITHSFFKPAYSVKEETKFIGHRQTYFISPTCRFSVQNLS